MLNERVYKDAIPLQTTMKRFISLLLLFAVFALQSHAVLKEKDLNQTLHVLRLELHNKCLRQAENIKLMMAQRENQHQQLVSYMKRCETTSLILYSQEQDFTFNTAFACEEATKLYFDLSNTSRPFSQIKGAMKSEIARYDSLIYSLQLLPPSVGQAKIDIQNAKREREKNSVQRKQDEVFKDKEKKSSKPFMLDKQGLEDRDMCIIYATILRDNLSKMLTLIERDDEHYDTLDSRVAKLHDYAQEKYKALQQSIFINPGTNYFKILMSIPFRWQWMQKDFAQKYYTLEEVNKTTGEVEKYRSEWRGPIVGFASVFMLVYILIATLISLAIFKWCIPKKLRTKTFYQKRPLFIMSLAIFIFAIVVMVLRLFIHHNLMLMATGLMIETAWLMEVIYLSLVIRLNGEQIRNGAKVYAPFIITSITVICFRIILIPNALVNLIFPPILLIFTIWQFITTHKYSKQVPTHDRLFCNISSIAMLCSCILAFVGFTLMAVQIMIWWTFQLAAITTIICCYDLMEMYETRVLEKRIKKAYGSHVSDGQVIFRMKRGDFIDKTWFYDFINHALVPVCAVYSIIFSILWAADIFDLRDLCMDWFVKEYKIKGIMDASAFKLSLIAALFFVFKYINYLIRSLWFRYRRNKGNKDLNTTLSKNLIALLTWGIYIIIGFLMLDVPSTGIAVVTGGLSTGMGFASKSLLENFFYGISLMTGRVRVGDYIECDGMIGKVDSITYQSTQIVTLDGSVVAILNSELFNKNFKNLTRNHQYELTKIPFGVAYGTNVDEVRKLILDEVRPLCVKTADGRDIVNPKNPISVAFSDFGASSVDLFFVAWILVDQKITFTCLVKEKIYEVLNKNNIEIPFPQQDIYIRSIAKME